MKSIAFIVLFANLLILGISSCERDEIYGDVVTDENLFNQLYRDSNDTMRIGSDTLMLETDLYEDFFPGFLPRDHKLVACIYLVNIDSMPVPSNLSISKLYIISGERIWISIPSDPQDGYTPSYKLYGISKNGPEWATGIYVDVVIEITDKLTANTYLLLAANQLLHRVE